MTAREVLDREVGWTYDEYMAAPGTIGRLHSRILDLQDLGESLLAERVQVVLRQFANRKLTAECFRDGRVMRRVAREVLAKVPR